MKKLMAILMTVVMACSMSVTAFAARASESNAKLSLNNEGNLYLQPYTIDGYTYFGLREVCGVLQGTVNEFDLNWNSGSKTTVIKTKTTGVPILSMSYTISYGPIIATPVDVAIEVDGQMLTMKAYNINSYNYFKLRDLADIIGFEVEWNGATKTINIVSPYGNPTPPASSAQESENQDSFFEPVDPNSEKYQELMNMKFDVSDIHSEKGVFKEFAAYPFFGPVTTVTFHGEDERIQFTRCKFGTLIVKGEYTLGENLILEECTYDELILK